MKKLLLLLILLSGCSGESKDNKPHSVKVVLAEVIEQEVPIYIEAIGNVQAHSFVKIRPQVGGILLKAYVKQGDFVKKGDLLFEIDSKPYEIAVREAQAILEKDQALFALARDVHERNKELVEKEYISRVTFDQYEANLKTTEALVKNDLATLERAKINLGYCKIYAPIDGKVSVFNIHPGNLVVANDPASFTDISEISPIDVSFSIPQKEFQELQKYSEEGPLTFEVKLPYESEKKYVGKIYFFDNHIDLQTGTILVKGLVDNEDRDLWPGEFATVRVLLKNEPHALLIPYSAVQAGPKGAYVYTLEPDSTVALTLVETGDKVGPNIVIKSGLKKGDKVVVQGQVNLRIGIKVEEESKKP